MQHRMLAGCSRKHNSAKSRAILVRFLCYGVRFHKRRLSLQGEIVNMFHVSVSLAVTDPRQKLMAEMSVAQKMSIESGALILLFL